MASKAKQIVSIDTGNKTATVRFGSGVTTRDYPQRIAYLDRNTLLVVARHLGYKLTKSPLKYTTRELSQICLDKCRELGEGTITIMEATPMPATPATPATPAPTPEVEVETQPQPTVTPTPAGGFGLDEVLGKVLRDYAKPSVDMEQVREMVVTATTAVLSDMDNRITNLTPKVTQVTLSGGHTHEIVGRTHFMMDKVLRVVDAGMSPWLTGTAGVGKTTIAEQVAQALGLEYSPESFCSQSSKSEIKGYRDGHGLYHSVDFRRRYEEGGVYLLDEIDAANPNILLTLNSALSNGWMMFPDGKVKRHEKFVAIASANTYGNGATAEYVGRQVIDGSTLDRFVKLDIPIDEDMEQGIVNDLSVDKFAGLQWLSVVRGARRNVQANGLKVIVSPRASYHGAKLLNAGFTYEECVPMTFGSGMKPDQFAKVMANVVVPAGGANLEVK